MGGILIAVIIGGSMITTQNMKQASIERQKQMEVTIEKNKILKEVTLKKIAKDEYDNCMLEASRNYMNNWDAQCEPDGQKEGCTQLSTWRAREVEESRDNDEKSCLELFKASN